MSVILEVGGGEMGRIVSCGRIDWKPRLKVWRVILYEGLKDVRLGDYAMYEDAVEALQDKVPGS